MIARLVEALVPMRLRHRPFDGSVDVRSDPDPITRLDRLDGVGKRIPVQVESSALDLLDLPTPGPEEPFYAALLAAHTERGRGKAVAS